MCLETRWIKPRVADKDITVYKTLYVGPVGPSMYVLLRGELTVAQNYEITSTGQGFAYTLGKTHKITRFGFKKNGVEQYVNEIHAGFHSFLNKADAHRHSGKPFECIIPKGSQYYVGTNNGSSDGYCSNQLIVVKPCV